MKNKGFTLIELIVAMGVASMVFLLTSSFLITVITANSKSQKTEAFEQVKNDLTTELTNAVRWAKDIQVSGGDILADGVVYHWESGRIFKNGEAITDENVEVNSFVVSNLSSDPEYASLKIEAELTHKQDVLAHDILNIVVSQRKLEVEHAP